ncbi:MAG: ester cyclase, partial [Burkholderiales bacterium]
RGGEVARHAAFVAHGCLRSFVIDAKGKEHVVQFAPEEWWLADAISLNSGTPSQYFFAAIEDSVQVEAVIAEGDIVVSRYTATATDTVVYLGPSPTGKVIRTSAMQMFRFSNGKIVESWAVRDDLGTLRQLGPVAMLGGPPKR